MNAIKRGDTISRYSYPGPICDGSCVLCASGGMGRRLIVSGASWDVKSRRGRSWTPGGFGRQACILGSQPSSLLACAWHLWNYACGFCIQRPPFCACGLNHVLLRTLAPIHTYLRTSLRLDPSTAIARVPRPPRPPPIALGRSRGHAPVNRTACNFATLRLRSAIRDLRSPTRHGHRSAGQSPWARRHHDVVFLPVPDLQAWRQHQGATGHPEQREGSAARS